MTSIVGLNFAASIPPVRENAVAIRRMVLHDMEIAGHPNPRSIANPDDEDEVKTQINRLRDNPGSYCGMTQDGVLVAFMKHNLWLAGDEAPFTDGFRRRTLLLRSKSKIPLLQQTHEVGVFHLAVVPELDTQRANAVRDRLLRIVYDELSPEKIVNIMLYDADPLVPIARKAGFRVSGPKREVPGVPGLLQHRYRRHPHRDEPYG